MTPQFAAVFLVAAAGLLAVTSLVLGPLAAFVASPQCVALLALAVLLRRGVAADAPRWIVGAAAGTVLLGVAFALAGSVVAGAAVVVAGVGVGVCGSQFALGFDPPPAGTALPSTADPALNAAVALDEGVKLQWELMRFAPRRVDEEMVSQVRAAADRNRERGWFDRPELAHPPPLPLEKPVIVRERVRGVGFLEQLTFASEFEPQDPEVRDAYLDARRNRTAHVYLLRHGGEPRPTLLCLHGFTMGRIAFDAAFWELSRLHALGLDLAVPVLPLHGPRALGRRSGQGFLAGHPLWTNAAMGQAVWELRRLTGWLRDRGTPSVGVMGFSLGGYTAALFASLEPGLACAVPMMPVSRISVLEWRMTPPVRRARARSVGLSVHLLDEAWARHSPLRVRPQLAHEARFVIGGLADRIVPPSQVSALWEHWGQPSAHWVPGTHLVWPERAALRSALDSHLGATLLA